MIAFAGGFAIGAIAFLAFGWAGVLITIPLSLMWGIFCGIHRLP